MFCSGRDAGQLAFAKVSLCIYNEIGAVNCEGVFLQAYCTVREGEMMVTRSQDNRLLLTLTRAPFLNTVHSNDENQHLIIQDDIIYSFTSFSLFFFVFCWGW